MSQKNHICFYGAHFETVAEKCKIHCIASCLVWNGIITYLEVWCYCFSLIEEIIFVYFLMKLVIKIENWLKHYRLKKGKSLCIASIIFILFLFFYILLFIYFRYNQKIFKKLKKFVKILIKTSKNKIWMLKKNFYMNVQIGSLYVLYKIFLLNWRGWILLKSWLKALRSLL